MKVQCTVNVNTLGCLYHFKLLLVTSHTAYYNNTSDGIYCMMCALMLQYHRRDWWWRTRGVEGTTSTTTSLDHTTREVLWTSRARQLEVSSALLSMVMSYLPFPPLTAIAKQSSSPYPLPLTHNYSSVCGMRTSSSQSFTHYSSVHHQCSPNFRHVCLVVEYHNMFHKYVHNSPRINVIF